MALTSNSGNSLVEPASSTEASSNTTATEHPDALASTSKSHHVDLTGESDDDDVVELIKRPLQIVNNPTMIPASDFILREHRQHTGWNIAAFKQGV